MSLSYDLRELLNRRSREGVSNTPDFILSTYMMTCLEAFEAATRQREAWYGVTLSPRVRGPVEVKSIKSD